MYFYIAAVALSTVKEEKEIIINIAKVVNLLDLLINFVQFMKFTTDISIKISVKNLSLKSVQV